MAELGRYNTLTVLDEQPHGLYPTTAAKFCCHANKFLPARKSATVLKSLFTLIPTTVRLPPACALKHSCIRSPGWKPWM